MCGLHTHRRFASQIKVVLCIEIDCVYKLWKWKKGGNPKPKSGYPLKTHFKLKVNKDVKSLEEQM